MARLARAVIPDRPHHVPQRGNRRQQTFANVMRDHEHTGRPLGDKPFVRRLDKHLGRRLLPGQPGRPRKDKEKPYGVPG